MIKTIDEMEGLIYLEDGTVFKGRGFGAKGTAVGELVFNTSMTGYQKILTDPSYKGQIINMTYPLIGNYGISNIDNESDGIHAFGLVVKDLCDMPSNSNSVKTMDEWLREQNVPGVFGVDTRKITKLIRKSGTVKCLISTEGISLAKAKELCDEGKLRGDWMKEVSTKEKYVLDAAPDEENKDDAFKVAVLDFGVKANILSGMATTYSGPEEASSTAQAGTSVPSSVRSASVARIFSPIQNTIIMASAEQRRFWRISRMVYSLPMARETLRKRQKL